MLLLAFGQSKSTDDWAADVRCPVTAEVIRSRFFAGWDIEDAITTESDLDDLGYPP